MTNNTKIRLFTDNRVKIAVPLKPQPDCKLNPEPNFLIFENIWSQDGLVVPFPNIQGIVEPTECVNSLCRLVYREWLEPGNNKDAEMREVVFDEIGNIPFPEDYFLVFKNHKNMIPQAAVINQFLPLFKFRGCLEGYKLEYDPAQSELYLEAVEAAKIEAEEANDILVNGMLQEQPVEE
jgi:hypothetical protein